MTTGARTGNAIHRAMPAFLTYGFRPFFLAAGLWSAVALTMWIVMLDTGVMLPSRFDPLAWHVHEMLFGFVMAAIAGFLLTAIPNWTGRLPVSGGPLALLAALWLLGRIDCLISATVPPWLAITADLSFPVVLVTIVAREIIVSRNWRNLPLVAAVMVLGIANLLMHLETDGTDVPSGLGWRLGLAAAIVLISVVAGRVIPNFTRNWLAKRQSSILPASHGWFDRIALGVLLAGLVLWAFLPQCRPIGLLLWLAAAFNLYRLLRWRGAATMAEPLLLVLHIGYAWLVFGIALLGFTTLGIDFPASAAIHALAAGGIGTMILAMMTRATRGHVGRELSADRITSLIYVLVTLAAITRVVAAFATFWTMPLLVVSAAFWIAASGGFVLAYGPMLLLPRRDR
jgi:uncharacterized protein involved in response to NO